MRRVLIVGAAVLALSAAGLPQAVATGDPDNTIVLDTGDSAYGKPLGLYAAASGGFVYARSEMTGPSMMFVQPTGGVLRATDWDSALTRTWASAQLLVHDDYQTGTMTFEDFDGTNVSTGTYDPENESVVGATGGGVLLQSFNGYGGAGHSVYNFYNCANCGQKRSLVLLSRDGSRTSIPMPAELTYSANVVVGPSGIAASVPVTATGSAVYYYSFAAGSWAKLLETENLADNVSFPDISGSTLLVRAGSALLAQPLDASSAVVLGRPSAVGPDDWTRAALAGDHVIMLRCQLPTRVFSASAAGGDWTELDSTSAPALGHLSCEGGPLSAGGSVLVSTAYDGTLTDLSGIWQLGAAGTTPVRVASTVARTLRARAVSLGAGRVVYQDDAASALPQEGPLWQRSLSGSGAGFTAGPAALVASHATGYGLSVSGRRVSYQPDVPVVGGAMGPAHLLVTGGGATTDSSWAPNAGLLSGLFGVAGSSVQNVATGDVYGAGPAPADGERYVLGTYAQNALVWDSVGITTGTPTNTLLVRDVTTGVEHALDPSAGGGSWATIGPDVVAWMSIAETPVDPGCNPLETFCVTTTSYTLHWQNWRTLGAAASWELPSSTQMVQGILVSESRIYWFADGSLHSIRISDAQPGSDVPIRASATFADVKGTTLAWLDTATAEPKAASLAVDTASPRQVGPGSTPTDLDARVAGAVWKAEWVFDHSLTSCAVTISGSGGLVRTLPCDPTVTGYGSVLTQWDGRNASGALVTTGTYTWTVVASGSGGAVRGDDGASTVVTGTIAVQGAPAPPPVVTPPSVRLTGTAVAASLVAPRVTWSTTRGTNPVARIEVRVAAGPAGKPMGGYGPVIALTPSTTAYRIPRPVPGTQYCVRVQAFDTVGTASNVVVRCSTFASNDTALAASSGGWKTLKLRGAMGGEVRVSTKAGATLTLAKAYGSRLVLVVGKQRGAGTVGVYVKGKLVATLKLAATSTVVPVLISIRSGSMRGVPVVVKVLKQGSSGARIDGLAVIK